MIFNSEIEFDKKRAVERFNFLISNKKTIEILEKKPKRSIRQNSYMHLIFSWFGIQTGYTLEEVKQDIFKKHVNPNLFYEGTKEKIHGIITDHWRSTASLDSGEMTTAINRFRNFASKEAGIYLPSPEDKIELQEIKNQIENNQEYL